ncbi:PREDICTED: retinol-binding protein 5 [Charadrius vociferus]|uniref:retinol-binding protein 5 n=1 Tax=Charadrius vociferus TaxID=50402 RepID=UPI000521277E|nr:PREDICTED: retinol-binding protein 5 [Charadrius vociferus]
MPPNLTGYYRFVSQENMDNYLRALDINVVLRKLVCLLKPDKEIIHTGDHMVIRTITSLRDYVMDFDLGVQFEEDLGPVDGRKCQTTVSWEGDQLVCEQLGEKRNRGWRHWLEGDQLHLSTTTIGRLLLPPLHVLLRDPRAGWVENRTCPSESRIFV